jgi:putative membrane protein
MTDAEFEKLEKRVHAITRPEKALLGLYVLTALASLCAFPLTMVILFFRWETLRYRFDRQGVSMAVGVLFKRQVQLTYERMQDIHLSQNLLERWLGLGTVTVQTAGAGAGGNVAIVGVKDAEAIRDYLYARMRGVRHEPTTPGDEADALLVEIRDALQGAAKALGGAT